jgi:hypothetical protein
MPKDAEPEAVIRKEAKAMANAKRRVAGAMA